MWRPKESSSEKATSCCWPWPWFQGSSSPDPKAAERQSPAGREGQPRGPPGLLLHVSAGLLALSPSCVLGLLPQLQRRWEEMAADTYKVHSFFILFIHREPSSVGILDDWVTDNKIINRQDDVSRIQSKSQI